MNTHAFRVFAALFLCSHLGMQAAQTAASTSAPHTNRAPLKLQVDRSPIDRTKPDPISYAPVVQRVAPSVVYVYSSRRIPGQTLPPFLSDPRFRRYFNLPETQNGRLPDRTQNGLGSGVVITADGYILTNNHVVEGATDVKVALGESRKRYDAKVVGSDQPADIAILKIEADGLKPATLGDSDMLQVGDGVLAIGNPFGVGQSVSRGIVSALGRGNLGIEAFEDFIQTDAAINPGNSGGALLDSNGRLVGINTAILSGSGGFAGVGFAIPINLARMLAEQIVNTGRVSRGYLGVAPQELTTELSHQFGTDQGVLISEVTPDSPAEKAGLQVGDIVTKINDEPIRDPRTLLLAVSQLAPETNVTIEFRRDGKVQTARAVLARRPEQTVAGTQSQSARDDGVLNGVAVGDITPEIRSQLQIPSRVQGAVVTNLDPASAAALQGLREGDIILQLDRQPVRNAAEAVRLSEQIKGPRVTILLWREGRNQFLVVDESRGQ